MGTKKSKKHGTSLPEVMILEQMWQYKISVLADMVARRTIAILQNISDVNLSQWRVMAAIADKPGRSAKEVVAVTPMDKGIVSRAVSRLIDRDLIMRRACEKDGRLSYLFLTQPGMASYDMIFQALQAGGTTCHGDLTPDQVAQFNALMDTLIKSY